MCGAVCWQLLHVVAPHVPSVLHSQLSGFLPSEFIPSRMPVADLYALATQLCCAEHCTEVFILLEHPINSIVSPFHIDRNALHAYSDGDILVVFFHQYTPEEDTVNTLGVSDSTTPSGTDCDICPLSVHGATENNLVSMSFNEQALRALNHLRTGGSILTVGSASSPESIYDNLARLLPGCFHGFIITGLVASRSPVMLRFHVSDVRYFHACLMYHDRRFQEDPYFPFIVLIQSQIRESTVCGYVLTEQ